MTRTHQIVFILLFSFIYSSYSQNCDAGTNCGTCTTIPGCGWCAATLTCSPGNSTGPADSKCIGAWEFESCTPCGSFDDCITCNQHQQDCYWCLEDSSCYQLGASTCNYTDYCPCNVYKDCGLCVDDRSCQWCEGDGGSCTEATSTCPTSGGSFNYDTGCPCSNNFDCEGCSAELGCQWCNTTNTCINFGTDASCPALPNCQAYCAQATTCDACFETHSGCEWCSADNKCYDSASVTNETLCKPVDSCPDCPAHEYCDTCMENGCQWCADTLTCAPQGSACSSVTYLCVDYCLRETSCESCNNAIGCGWCSSDGICIDMDTAQTCVVDEDCSANPNDSGENCGFDAGAFVGGMFLVIGLLILAMIGYFVYVFKFGRKASYSQL